MTNLNREIQEMIAARAKEPRAFGEALAAEIQGNPSVGDTTTKEAFKTFEDSVDAAFAKNAFMQRSVELGITGSALYQQILATKFANQATEESIRWKEQENTLLDRFNAIVTLDQEGDGLQQMTFAVDRAFTSYICWNQFRIRLRDALQELFVS